MFNSYQNPKEFLDFKGVRDGRVAIIYHYNYLQVYKQFLQSEDFVEDIDFHIHKDSEQPFFMYSNKLTVNDSMSSQWNFVYDLASSYQF